MDKLNKKQDFLSREYAEELAPKIPVIWKKSDSDTDKVNKGIVAGYMACAEHAIKLYDPEKMYNWLTSEKREPAQTHFTAGPERNVARELQFLLNQRDSEIKQLMKERDQARNFYEDQVKRHNDTLKENERLKKENERLRSALKNLLDAVDDEGWNIDGEDYPEQRQARQALNQQEQ